MPKKWTGLQPEQRTDWENQVRQVTSLNAGVDAQKTGGQLIQLAITKKGEKTDTLYRRTPIGWMYRVTGEHDDPNTCDPNEWVDVGDMEMIVYLNMTVAILRLDS